MTAVIAAPEWTEEQFQKIASWPWQRQVLGAMAHTHAPHLVSDQLDDQVRAGALFYMYANEYRAARQAASTLPLVRRVVDRREKTSTAAYAENPVVLQLQGISYYPQKENVFLREYMWDQMALQGVTPEDIRKRVNDADSERRPIGNAFSCGLERIVFDPVGTLSVALNDRHRLTGTLRIDSLGVAGFPELTADILPPGVFKPNVHKIEEAGNLYPAAGTDGMLPANLERISVYAKDHHGSGWSFHCRGYAPK